VAARYALESQLGQGGMGEVWSATNRVTGGRVALKFIRHSTHDTAGELRRRFLREARAVAQIEHPNVVGVRDVVEHDGAPVIVMDLLQGETLAQRLARLGRLPVGDTARIVLAVIAGVGAAHELGLIHRDLKPENVFVANTSSGEVVRVLDFGIAKSMHEERADPSSAITASGALIGTPSYMAPEQLFGEKVLDHRVDVWAIGAILYESLVGQRYAGGDNYGLIVKDLLGKQPLKLSSKLPDVPDDLARLVERMLAHERTDRLDDLREAAAVLARHASQPRPSFGPPLTRPLALVDSDTDARVVVSGRADPSAPTLEASHDAIARTGDAPAPRSRVPWVVGALVLLGGSAFAIRSLTSARVEGPTATSSTSSVVAASTTTIAAETTTTVSVTVPTPSVSASVMTITSASASPSVSTASDKKPVPTTTTKIAVAIPPVVKTTASTPPTASVAPPPPPTASATSGGLVTKPPF
jgi:eukaryotic-like serine/threonine-protein kinase